MIPTAQIIAKGLHENCWSVTDWHHRHVRPQRMYYSAQCWNFLIRVAAVGIQRCHRNSPEDVFVPGTKKHPHFVSLFLKLHATAPVWLCPIDAARQNPRMQPIENDGLKHATNWLHTGYVDNTAQIEILTETSSRDQVTSTFTRTADRVNCSQSR